ncbi:MAG TPA: hypothetical protein PLZ57_14380 [Pseudobdellovibrionaceae bacterium]|nr:hypothetical protein [Pseudobdellovibrionaceae bacterium]
MSRKVIRQVERNRELDALTFDPAQIDKSSVAVNWSARSEAPRTWRRLRFADLAPFLSLAVITSGLFAMALAKMEVRRLGYAIVHLAKDERRWRDEERGLNLALAKAMGPERLEAMAGSKLTLRRPQQGEVIQMTENGVALEQ